MKDSFWLNNNTLNVVKEFLRCFTIFWEIEKEIIYGFNVTTKDTNGIYCIIKAMLKLMFNNSFISY